MTTITHRFLDHQIHPETEILVIGTFNPNADKNPADFFYGRGRNFLWKLLPTVFLEESLKGKSKEEKSDFIQRKKIDFIDLISEVAVDEGQDTNYADAYIDGKVIKWRNILGEMQKLGQLKKVCLTRKSFADVPNMKAKINEIEIFCKEKGIHFQCLPTPARFYNQEKQSEWNSFFSSADQD